MTFAQVCSRAKLYFSLKLHREKYALMPPFIVSSELAHFSEQNQIKKDEDTA